METKIYSLKDYADFDSAYWGMGKSSDGKIYFGLCSHTPGKSAGFFSFDPVSEAVTHIFNVNDILGNAHGKIHTPIFEGRDRKLYFGTHFAYPFGDPTNEVDYEGGHILCFDPASRRTVDYGIVRQHEGIITIALDAPSEKIYALTIPSGYLVQLDIATKTYKELGKLPSNGSICRTITVGGNGKVYGSFEDDGLFTYDPTADTLDLNPGYFPSEQVEEWNAASRGGVNKIGRKLWRCAAYDEKRNLIYGIYSASSRCFTIDCQTLKLEVYEPMIPDSYAPATDIYPTLSMMTTDSHLFYAPADGMFDYCRSDNMRLMSHLMRYDKASKRISDMGELSDSGRHVFGTAGAVFSKGNIFLLGAIEAGEGPVAGDKEDRLFRIHGEPFELGLVRIVPPDNT
jgi:hypothetical protein